MVNHDETHVKATKEGVSSVVCFLDELKDIGSGGDRDISPQFPNSCQRANVNWTWPVQTDMVDEAMSQFIEMKSCNADENNQTATIEKEYENLIGFSSADQKLRFVTITVDSSVMDPFSRLGEDVTRVEYDYFVQIASDMDKLAKDACGPVLMTDTDQKFIFMNTQKIYRTSAVQGALIGVAIAFIVLFLCTQNFLIALFASTSILFVLISVVGTVTMIGALERANERKWPYPPTSTSSKLTHSIFARRRLEAQHHCKHPDHDFGRVQRRLRRAPGLRLQDRGRHQRREGQGGVWRDGSQRDERHDDQRHGQHPLVPVQCGVFREVSDMETTWNRHGNDMEIDMEIDMKTKPTKPNALGTASARSSAQRLPSRSFSPTSSS